MMTFRTIASALMLAAAFAAPAMTQQATDAVQPEGATTAPRLVPDARPVKAKTHMVVAANPLAAAAGLDMLERGGSAADAVLAVQSVLGLVEPQSSGLGGGAFLVYYDAASGKVTTIDGRETAPADAGPDLFLDLDGKPLRFFDAVVGGRSVGVPGTVRLLEMLHDRYGKLAWGPQFDAAINLARNGFDVSPRLAGLLEEDRERLAAQPTTQHYFFDQAGLPLRAGALLVNPDYAETLEALVHGGADAFYKEAIADRIIDAVRLHDGNPGKLAIEDLKAYRARERAPICQPYRAYQVCGMGPPSSGGLTIAQILGMVAEYDLATLGPDDPQALRIIGDATRLAFADRGRYMADSDFVDMPGGLADPGYLKERAKLINRPDALEKDMVNPGEPPWKKAELRIDGIDASLPSTSHFVVVDRQGNVASMTSSIENAFGARLMAGGFLLNNQLTDFDFVPQGTDGKAVANRVEPGKRPRSSMSPTIVLKDGKPVFAIGSPGGSRIIPYVANALIALIDWNMNIAQAVSLPHLVNRFGTFDLEAGTNAEAMAPDLEVLGYETAARDLNSGLHGIAIMADGSIEGAADPRREGVAIGD